MRILFFIYITLLLNSCFEESETIDFRIHESYTQSGLTNIHFYDDLHALIVGGDMWSKGIALQTEDGGISWTLDSITDKKLIGLSVDPEFNTVSVGVDGYFFEKPPQTADWKFRRLRDWDVLRDVSGLESGGYVCVGGSGLSTGMIYLINSNYETDTVFRFEHEFRGVECVSDETCFVVGFGHVVRINPGNQSVEYIPIEGDFFLDIQFVDNNNGFILGLTGTVFNSNDGGKNWHKISSGSAYTKSTKAVRRIYFTDLDNGYRVGDKGLIQVSNDGGKKWKSVHIDFEGQINDLKVVNNRVFIISEEGDILSFDKE